MWVGRSFRDTSRRGGGSVPSLRCHGVPCGASSCRGRLPGGDFAAAQHGYQGSPEARAADAVHEEVKNAVEIVQDVEGTVGDLGLELLLRGGSRPDVKPQKVDADRSGGKEKDDADSYQHDGEGLSGVSFPTTLGAHLLWSLLCGSHHLDDDNDVGAKHDDDRDEAQQHNIDPGPDLQGKVTGGAGVETHLRDNRVVAYDSGEGVEGQGLESVTVDREEATKDDEPGCQHAGSAAHFPGLEWYDDWHQSLYRHENQGPGG